MNYTEAFFNGVLAFLALALLGGFAVAASESPLIRAQIAGVGLMIGFGVVAVLLKAAVGAVVSVLGA